MVSRWRPFFYSDEMMIEIPVPPGHGFAFGLNEAGVVVGELYPPSGFIYRDGVVTELVAVRGH
jgi:hypothetical protein